MNKQKEIISGIYQIKNTKTNKLYIGSSVDVYKRFEEHKRALKKGTHHSTKLQRSYTSTKDKSVFVFEIIKIVENIDKLKEIEQFYIDKYDSFNAGYNCSALVDNPKYTERNLKKKRRKQNQINSYKLFWELYDENAIQIGNTFMERIRSKHYDIGTMNKLNSIMEWFYNSYDKTKYYIYIGYSGATCWINVYDKNDNKFAVYCATKKNVYHSPHDTEFYINNLKKNELYDETVHIVVDTKLDYSTYRAKEKIRKLKAQINYINQPNVNKGDREWIVKNIPKWESEIKELCEKYNLS